MESDQEQSVIALKSFLHNLGFDKNDPQRAIDQNRSSANLAVSKINLHLFKFPRCIIAMQWKDHFNSFFKSNSGAGSSSTEKSVLISSNSHSNGPIERSLFHAKSRNGPKMIFFLILLSIQSAY